MKDDFPTPTDWPPREFAPLADDLAPIVHAGKARACALEIVRLTMMCFNAPKARERIEQDRATWLIRALDALWQWTIRACEIDDGSEQLRPPAQRLTLLDVAGAADLIAANANARRKVENRNGEAWIVYETATALWRACRCCEWSAKAVRVIEGGRDDETAGVIEREYASNLREHHDHTARILLPLLVRDVRALLAEQRMNASAIEATIVAHGGKVS